MVKDRKMQRSLTEEGVLLPGQPLCSFIWVNWKDRKPRQLGQSGEER